jgi:hypothetical protein
VWCLYSQARPGGGPADRADAWSTEAHLLASLIDLANVQLWTFRAANTKEPGPKPKPIPRPGDQAKEEPKQSPRSLGLPVVDLRKKAP